MAPSELLAHVATTLEELRVPYFVTGSVASIAYGEPRMTADVDIVAGLGLSHVQPLAAAFPEDRYYLSVDVMREAIRSSGQFNIIDSMSGYKADIIIPGSSPLEEQRFAMARRLKPAGATREYWFSAPEHIILKKLEFYREGESQKHLRDIAGMLKVMGSELDRTYIEQWAARLGVIDMWRTVEQRAARS